MLDDPETRRAELDMLATIANVAGDEGIQHAAWWKIVLTVVVIVGMLAGVYALVGTRYYEGPLVWHEVADSWQLELGTTGTVVDFGNSGGQLSANGVQAALPGSLSTDITSARAKVSWTPYLFKRGGASGEAQSIDLELPIAP